MDWKKFIVSFHSVLALNELHVHVCGPMDGHRHDRLLYKESRLEKLFDEHALKLLEYYQKNMFNGKLAGLDREEILDKYKKKKGLWK